MRTKTLLLSAVLGAASVISAVAQTAVYSVNAVGYVNVTVPPGFSMIANPLLAQDNTVKTLLASVPDGTQLFKFNNGKYDINSFDFGTWQNPDDTLMPGEGAFISNPETAAFTVTFVGDVPQGKLTNSLPAGFSIKSSIVPQSAGLSTVLMFPAEDDDQVYRFLDGKYTIYSFSFGEWSTEPVPAVCESFFVSKVNAGQWVREFNVNQ